MGMNHFTLFLGLVKEVQPPEKGILSRTLHADEKSRR
jgi:hypothetical protein